MKYPGRSSEKENDVPEVAAAAAAGGNRGTPLAENKSTVNDQRRVSSYSSSPHYQKAATLVHFSDSQ